MVPADSPRISRVLGYSGCHWDKARICVRGCHLLWLSFPTDSASLLCAVLWSFYPTYAVTWVVWAVPCSLATTDGIIVIFFSSGYLDVSVPRVGLPLAVYHLGMMGCPIRRSTGLGLFAPYRGFSQLITSFFASESLGILHAPFVTFLALAFRPGCMGRLWFVFCSLFVLQYVKDLCGE